MTSRIVYRQAGSEKVTDEVCGHKAREILTGNGTGILGLLPLSVIEDAPRKKAPASLPFAPRAGPAFRRPDSYPQPVVGRTPTDDAYNREALREAQQAESRRAYEP